MPATTVVTWSPKGIKMSTILIIVLVIILLGGGGFYGRGRWF